MVTKTNKRIKPDTASRPIFCKIHGAKKRPICSAFYAKRKNIFSVLNNTKWERLFKELQEIEFTLDFQRKDLDETDPSPNYWDSDLYHVMGGWEQIEWLNIRALISSPKGALVKPEIEDNTQLLIKALRQSGVPYCMHNDGIRIWGYLRPGVSPEWIST